MKKSHQKITGILLAGGMSSRMGREKGSMMLGKHMMYEYPLKVLESVCDNILISSNKALPDKVSYAMVSDEIVGIGPMGGIYTCLKHSSTDLNLVLSYDMPLINEALLLYLINHSSNWDILAPAMQTDRPEPLCALYRKSMLKIFEGLIAEKQYAVHRVLSISRSHILHITPDLPFYRSDLFMNINREEDLAALPDELRNEN